MRFRPLTGSGFHQHRHLDPLPGFKRGFRPLTGSGFHQQLMRRINDIVKEFPSPDGVWVSSTELEIGTNYTTHEWFPSPDGVWVSSTMFARYGELCFTMTFPSPDGVWVSSTDHNRLLTG